MRHAKKGFEQRPYGFGDITAVWAAELEILAQQCVAAIVLGDTIPLYIPGPK